MVAVLVLVAMLVMVLALPTASAAWIMVVGA